MWRVAGGGWRVVGGRWWWSAVLGSGAVGMYVLGVNVGVRAKARRVMVRCDEGAAVGTYVCSAAKTSRISGSISDLQIPS